jgi:hypothetical protein
VTQQRLTGDTPDIMTDAMNEFFGACMMVLLEQVLVLPDCDQFVTRHS